MNRELISKVVSEVITKLNESGAETVNGSYGPSIQTRQGRRGLYSDASEAAAAAARGQDALRRKGVQGRVEIVNLIKGICADKAEEWGKLEFEETKVGRLAHKIEKLSIVQNVPGVEGLNPYGMSGDRGITLEEFAPFGVIAAITPVTHSIPTIAGNIVSMVAAGNGVVFNAHPGGAKCAAHAIAYFNDAIYRKTGIEDLLTIVEEPSIESFNALCSSKDVNLICVTGGPGVVAAAMKSGKRSICAGPGNPPAVVDESADLDLAACSIIQGGGYDNNLLCIGEKQVIVVDRVYSKFLEAFERAGAYRLSHEQMKRLAGEVFSEKKDAQGHTHLVLNRANVGADAGDIAKVAGVNHSVKAEVLFSECDMDCPFVEEEQMMPVLPVVRARDVDDAIEKAYVSERNFRHSAIMHSKNLDSLTKMGQRMNCTLFVKNGPSVAGLGLGGQGYLNYSIATTTGEGIVTTATFTRRRRCVLVDNLNIIG